LFEGFCRLASQQGVQVVIDARRASPNAESSETSAEPRPSIEQIYEHQADFVWCSLQRLGLRAQDLDDVFQDVFEIAQRGLPQFRGDNSVRSWLFGICVRQVKRQRFRAWFRREPVELAPADAVVRTPEADALTNEALGLLERALRALSPEQRAVFTMCEVERMSGDEVAELLGVPVGTVYSRLHAARKRFEAQCQKLRNLGLFPEASR
jgi:RNA polymerase sigma-70 factor (ECF subfamily)